MATSMASARRYAQAVFEIAVERQEQDQWQADLDRIAFLGEDPSLTVLLENPRLRFDDKARIFADALKDISQMALNLVYVLISKGRLSLAPDIANHYREMLDGQRGIERAEVVTAVPLNEEDKQQLEARLGAMINKRVILKPQVDTEMLGGFVARVGGKLLDGSVRSRLVALKNEISRVAR